MGFNGIKYLEIHFLMHWGYYIHYTGKYGQHTGVTLKMATEHPILNNHPNVCF